MSDSPGNERADGRVYSGSVARLRSERRLRLIDPERVVSAALEGEDIESALDVGTGSGLFAENFAKRGIRCAGVDVKREMLLAAREFAPKASFLLAAAESLPFRDRSFSMAFLGHLLHESADPVRVLSECRRVARMRTVVLEWPRRPEDAGPPMDHRLEPGLIRKFAQDAGFDCVRPVPHPDMTLMVLS